MTNFKIDKNITPPSTTGSFISIAKEMVVGDSILVTRAESSSLSRAIKVTGYLTTTARDKDQEGMVRVWKLEKLKEAQQAQN